ncbi:MAG: hypothetical protein DI629_16625 [Mesorhizobium amorphae]|nr:MAG: hypothetical protein DI629_16625 [Mesorhizobium amorphae]
MLHVFNIAQNAYLNAFLMNARGYDCDVLSFDWYHFASSPEWNELFDADLGPDAFPDAQFPDFYALGKAMPVIPDFAAVGPLFQALLSLVLKREGDPRAQTARDVLSYLRFKCTVFRTPTPFACEWREEAFQRRLAECDLPDAIRLPILRGRLCDRVFLAIRHRLMRFASPAELRAISAPLPRAYLDGFMAYDDKLKRLIEPLRARGLLEALGLEYEPDEGPGPAIEGADAYRTYAPLWRRLRACYDACVFYANSPIFALANDLQPYCALEIGTIRALPFADTPFARLLTESYGQAAKVFITNADYVTAEPRLEFVGSQRVFALHPFDEQRAMRFARDHADLRARGTAVRFLAPARQDWTARDPQMSKGNDLCFRALRLAIDRGAGDLSMTCVAWGTDLEASRALVAELGLQAHVEWVPPLTKRQLWEAMLGHHAVIDQFLIPAISGVAFEALALGCRLITWDDGVSNRTFFGTQPPILSAQSVDEIARRLMEVARDPEDREGWGEQGVAWIEAVHSTERNVALQAQAFADIEAAASNGSEQSP